MKLLQNTPTCAWKLYFEATKVLLVCVFLISKTILFLNMEKNFVLRFTLKFGEDVARQLSQKSVSGNFFYFLLLSKVMTILVKKMHMLSTLKV